MNTTDPNTLQQKKQQQTVEKRTRFNGVSLFLTEAGMMVGYGISGSFNNDTFGLSVLYTQILPLILMFLFLIIGFGMLLNAYRFGNLLGISTLFIVLAIGIQLSPLLQKLWISIILNNFGESNSNIGTSPAATWWNLVTGTKIAINTYVMRTTLISIIASMVVMTGTIGRMGVTQIIKFATFFQIFWGINFFLLIYFNVLFEDFNYTSSNTPYFFDMFGSTYTYLFGAFFGLPITFFMKKQYIPHTHPKNQFNKMSLILSQIGTGFIIALFVFTSSYVINYDQTTLLSTASKYQSYIRFSILFGVMGSIVGTFIASALFGKGRVGYKEVLTGTISGCIMMGAAAPIIDNIGIIIMIGTVSGFICGWYMRVIHIRVNKNYVYDALGMFGPFLLSAFLGSFVVVPAILAGYKFSNQPFVFSGAIIETPLIGYQLIYVGISAGIGLTGGLFLSFMNSCDKQNFGLATNQSIYLQDFGLFNLAPQPQAQNQTPNLGGFSQQSLNHGVLL